MNKILIILALALTLSGTCAFGQMTELMNAASQGDITKVEALINSGVDVNCDNGFRGDFELIPGQTALMFAAEYGHLDIVKLLIKAGADANARAGCDQPHIGKTVLWYALKSRSIDIVKELITSGANVNEFVDGGLSSNFAENLSGQGNKVRNNPLLTYAISRHLSLDIIKELIKAGNVNIIDWYDCWTPLMFASYIGSTNVVKELIKAGANKNKKNGEGKTALDFAKKAGNIEIIKLLQ